MEDIFEKCPHIGAHVLRQLDIETLDTIWDINETWTNLMGKQHIVCAINALFHKVIRFVIETIR